MKNGICLLASYFNFQRLVFCIRLLQGAVNSFQIRQNKQENKLVLKNEKEAAETIVSTASSI